MNRQTQEPLADHVDMRLVETAFDDLSDRNLVVVLAPDHPGFSDQAYRERRNEIARLALEYRPGEPLPYAPYTEQEQDVWRTIWRELAPAHRRHACAEYLKCLARLDCDQSRIPQLRDVSEKVQAISGFRLEPVAGLIEPRVFLESLAQGVFLCTQYIRHHSTPLYTPEPDVAHEIIGHAVTLASEKFAELNRLFGEAVKRTSDVESLDRLSRVYWFTIEFGVLKEDGTVKAFGTGLLSSAGELEEMHRAELVPLDLNTASQKDYDPTHYQQRLFCAESFEEMYDGLKDYLIKW
jgi:phenylalanine-4-hydroxylase